jgi:hypothetical protein
MNLVFNQCDFSMPGYINSLLIHGNLEMREHQLPPHFPVTFYLIKTGPNILQNIEIHALLLI